MKPRAADSTASQFVRTSITVPTKDATTQMNIKRVVKSVFANAKDGFQKIGDFEKPLFEHREPNTQIVGHENL